MNELISTRTLETIFSTPLSDNFKDDALSTIVRHIKKVHNFKPIFCVIEKIVARRKISIEFSVGLCSLNVH